MAGGKKEHVEKVLKSNFNRQRAETATLRSNCGTDGYVFTKVGSDPASAAGQCQFHHVLPVCSLQDAAIKNLKKEQMEFIHKCMAKTTWDINEQPNLIGLPTKAPYYDADRQAAKKGATSDTLKALSALEGEFGALPDLPCHLNDHDKFNTLVINMLNDAVWPELLGSRAQCEDKGKSIRSVLRTQSKDWKQQLKDRGAEEGGAAECWVKREDEKKPVWYIPLSMDLGTPEPLTPPINIYKQTGPKKKAWLAAIFSSII